MVVNPGYLISLDSLKMAEWSDTPEYKKKFLVAFEEAMGIVSYACRKSNVHRSTYYTWYNNDPEFAKQIDAINDATVDEVELALLNKIKEGDITAIIFYTKCKMKNRGYTEKPKRTKIEIPEANTIEEINKAINLLIDKLARAEITEEDVKPIRDLLMDKLKAIEVYDTAKQLVELRHMINNK